MSRLHTRGAETSANADFETFAYYKANNSSGPGVTPTWLPISYHTDLPVIQTSDALWNYWNEEESKFPDVYFTACESGYILAEIDRLPSPENWNTLQISCAVADCRTEYLFEDIHTNDPIMSNIFCATDWEPRTFYRKNPAERPQSHHHTAGHAVQISSLENIGVESTAHIVATITRSRTPPMQSLSAISPTQTLTITTPTLYPQTPPPLPIIRATTSPTTTTTSTRTLIPSDPGVPGYFASPAPFIGATCGTLGAIALVILIAILLRRRKHKPNPYLPPHPMIDMLPTLPTGPAMLDKVRYGGDEGYEWAQRSTGFCGPTKVPIVGGLTSNPDTGREEGKGWARKWFRRWFAR